MKEYNPQGGSLPHSLLPRVASYRRQPRAIESTTPMGLPYYYPLIIMPPHVTSSHPPMGLPYYYPLIIMPLRGISSHHSVGLPYYYPLTTTLQRGISSYHPMGLHISLPIYHNHNHGDEDNIAVEFAHHCPFIITPRHRDGARHGHLL